MLISPSLIQHTSTVLLLGGSTIGGVSALAQWAVPDATVNPYAWIAAGLCIALGFVFKLYDKSKNDHALEITKRADRAEGQVDTLTPVISQNTEVTKEAHRSVDALVGVVESSLAGAVAAAQNNGALIAAMRDEHRSDHAAIAQEMKELRVKFESIVVRMDNRHAT